MDLTGHLTVGRRFNRLPDHVRDAGRHEVVPQAELEALADEAWPDHGARGWAADACAVAEARLHGDSELLRAYCRFRGQYLFDDVRGALRALRRELPASPAVAIEPAAIEAFVAVKAAEEEASERGEDTLHYRTLSRVAVTRPADLPLILAVAPRQIADTGELGRLIDEMRRSCATLREGSL